jgi:hypothetical protein
MYILYHNNRVLVGPRSWNRGIFQSALTKEGISYSDVLPRYEPNHEVPIVIDANTGIKKVRVEYPSHNDKIEYLVGPYYDLTEDVAIATYNVTPRPLDMIRGNLKDRVAKVRWSKEISGTTATIQDTEVSISTTREDRSIYTQQLSVMGNDDTVKWKFPEGWLTLTKAELTTVANAAQAFVQTAFDEEYSKVVEIETAADAATLDAIVIGDEPKEPNLLSE